MARAFNKAGFACAGLDVEGHGQSRGVRGFIESWSRVLDDLVEFLPHAREEAEVGADAPLFILGHSMGGTYALALASALEQAGTPAAGLVLSAPMVEVDPAVATPFLLAMQAIVNATIPGLIVQQIENTRVCNNRAVVEDYDEDVAGCPGDVYAKTGGELLALTEHVRRAALKMKTPLQVHHSKTDALTDFHATQRLVESYGSESIAATTGAAASGGEGGSEAVKGNALTEFVAVEDGSGHELMFEKSGDQHVARMIKWVQKRLNQ